MRYIVSVKIQLTLCCPRCHGQSIKKNGTKRYGKQNYLCKDCSRQFIGDHNLTYIGCRSNIIKTILKMLVRNCGIRDISEITGCSRYKVQKVLKTSQHHVLPKNVFIVFVAGLPRKPKRPFTDWYSTYAHSFSKVACSFPTRKNCALTHHFGDTAKRCNSFRLAISTSAPINPCTDEAMPCPCNHRPQGLFVPRQDYPAHVPRLAGSLFYP